MKKCFFFKVFFGGVLQEKTAWLEGTVMTPHLKEANKVWK